MGKIWRKRHQISASSNRSEVNLHHHRKAAGCCHCTSGANCVVCNYGFFLYICRCLKMLQKRRHPLSLLFAVTIQITSNYTAAVLFHSHTNAAVRDVVGAVWWCLEASSFAPLLADVYCLVLYLSANFLKIISRGMA